MMLPILISVSEAPESYFFWASAPGEVAAQKASAAELTPDRQQTADILEFPFQAICRIEYVSDIRSIKSPLQLVVQRALFWPFVLSCYSGVIFGRTRRVGASHHTLERQCSITRWRCRR